MAEVLRFVLSDACERREIVNYLDWALRDQPDDVKDLIAVSLVENIESEQEFEKAVEGADAEFLRKEWRRQHDL